ncbi:MAG: hypothetical protein ACW981_00200 [Candidatus Hodarchaeales archaeon]|jgi:hypothetical protein
MKKISSKYGYFRRIVIGISLSLIICISATTNIFPGTAKSSEIPEPYDPEDPDSLINYYEVIPPADTYNLPNKYDIIYYSGDETLKYVSDQLYSALKNLQSKVSLSPIETYDDFKHEVKSDAWIKLYLLKGYQIGVEFSDTIISWEEIASYVQLNPHSFHLFGSGSTNQLTSILGQYNFAKIEGSDVIDSEVAFIWYLSTIKEVIEETNYNSDLLKYFESVITKYFNLYYSRIITKTIIPAEELGESANTDELFEVTSPAKQVLPNGDIHDLDDPLPDDYALPFSLSRQDSSAYNYLLSDEKEATMANVPLASGITGLHGRLIDTLIKAIVGFGTSATLDVVLRNSVRNKINDLFKLFILLLLEENPESTLDSEFWEDESFWLNILGDTTTDQLGLVEKTNSISEIGELVKSKIPLDQVEFDNEFYNTLIELIKNVILSSDQSQSLFANSLTQDIKDLFDSLFDTAFTNIRYKTDLTPINDIEEIFSQFDTDFSDLEDIMDQNTDLDSRSNFVISFYQKLTDLMLSKLINKDKVEIILSLLNDYFLISKGSLNNDDSSESISKLTNLVNETYFEETNSLLDSVSLQNLEEIEEFTNMYFILQNNWGLICPESSLIETNTNFQINTNWECGSTDETSSISGINSDFFSLVGNSIDNIFVNINYDNRVNLVEELEAFLNRLLSFSDLISSATTLNNSISSLTENSEHISSCLDNDDCDDLYNDFDEMKDDFENFDLLLNEKIIVGSNSFVNKICGSNSDCVQVFQSANSPYLSVINTIIRFFLGATFSGENQSLPLLNPILFYPIDIRNSFSFQSISNRVFLNANINLSTTWGNQYQNTISNFISNLSWGTTNQNELTLILEKVLVGIFGLQAISENTNFASRKMFSEYDGNGSLNEFQNFEIILNKFLEFVESFIGDSGYNSASDENDANTLVIAEYLLSIKTLISNSQNEGFFISVSQMPLLLVSYYFFSQSAIPSTNLITDTLHNNASIAFANFLIKNTVEEKFKFARKAYQNFWGYRFNKKSELSAYLYRNLNIPSHIGKLLKTKEIISEFDRIGRSIGSGIAVNTIFTQISLEIAVNIQKFTPIFLDKINQLLGTCTLSDFFFDGYFLDCFKLDVEVSIGPAKVSPLVIGGGVLLNTNVDLVDNAEFIDWVMNNIIYSNSLASAVTKTDAPKNNFFNELKDVIDFNIDWTFTFVFKGVGKKDDPSNAFLKYLNDKFGGIGCQARDIGGDKGDSKDKTPDKTPDKDKKGEELETPTGTSFECAVALEFTFKFRTTNQPTIFKPDASKLELIEFKFNIKLWFALVQDLAALVNPALYQALDKIGVSIEGAIQFQFGIEYAWKGAGYNSEESHEFTIFAGIGAFVRLKIEIGTDNLGVEFSVQLDVWAVGSITFGFQKSGFSLKLGFDLYMTLEIKMTIKLVLWEIEIPFPKWEWRPPKFPLSFDLIKPEEQSDELGTANDKDFDTLADEIETSFGTDPECWDSDHDLIGDFAELRYYRTDQLSSDTDKDRIPDGFENLGLPVNRHSLRDFEKNYRSDTTCPSVDKAIKFLKKAIPDADKDFISKALGIPIPVLKSMKITEPPFDSATLVNNKLASFLITQSPGDVICSDPFNYDTDYDGLTDHEEFTKYFTSPCSSDTDNDGLSDWYEVNRVWDIKEVTSSVSGVLIGGEIYSDHTDPLNPDTDNDGLLDGQEGELGPYWGDPTLYYTPDTSCVYDDSCNEDPLLVFNQGYTHPLDNDTDDDSYVQLLNGSIAGTGPARIFVADMRDGVEVNGITTTIIECDDGTPPTCSPVIKKFYTNPTNPDSDGDTAVTNEDRVDPWPDPYSPPRILIGDGYELYIKLTDPLYGDTDHDGLKDGLEGADLPNRDYTTNPFDPDTDGDGLPDGLEYALGTNPSNPDSDADFVLDGDEYNLYHTSPHIADTDTDGLSDGWELFRSHSNPFSIDTDADGLTDYIEILDTFTDPVDSDSDNDGILDNEELILYATNPSSADTDGDGLRDNYEIFIYRTNPLDIDSDGDSLLYPDEFGNPTFLLTDKLEVDLGTDPNSMDSDNDNIRDSWELYLGTKDIPTINPIRLDPTNPDTDGDGLSDSEEISVVRIDTIIYPYFSFILRYPHDSSPVSADTDNDGLNDKFEFDNGLKLNSSDTDGDTLSDWDELFVHLTNPNANDTDGDGLSDSEELTAFTSSGNQRFKFNKNSNIHQTIYDTSATDSDTDNDGWPDGLEVLGSNPLYDPLDSDTNKNNILDAYEIDTDSDGLSDGEEFYVYNFKADIDFIDTNFGPNDGFLNFNDTDSDKDGIPDGDEVFTFHTLPYKFDTDDDGFSDTLEIYVGTDPNVFTSGEEFYDAINRLNSPLIFRTPEHNKTYDKTSLTIEIINATTVDTVWFRVQKVGDSQWSENTTLSYNKPFLFGSSVFSGSYSDFELNNDYNIQVFGTYQNVLYSNKIRIRIENNDFFGLPQEFYSTLTTVLVATLGVSTVAIWFYRRRQRAKNL